MAHSIQPLDDHDQTDTKADAIGDRPMETVGVYLKNERESKNLSLREVARLTKISELYLDCIEKDDYEKIPKGPYVKGYISSYSRMIGGDTEQALRLYDSANNKKKLEEDPPLAMPQPKGWRASVASAFASMVEAVKQIKERRLKMPSLTFGKGDTAAHAVHPEDPQRISAGKGADDAEPSVLIPFKKFAPPPRTDGAEPAPPDTPTPPAESTENASAASLAALRSKLAGALDAAGPWLRTRISNRLPIHWPIPMRQRLLTLAMLIVGATIMLFFGFGVYHVFFFDAPAPIATGGDGVSAGESETASSPPSLLTLRHKAAKFKKPADLTPPQPAVSTVEAQSSPARAPLPAKETASPPPIVDRERPRPENDRIAATGAGTAKPTTTADAEPVQPAETESAPPAEANVNVKVIKATICSAITDRMPAGVATTFPMSVERVYVWSHVQAKAYPTVIRHMYYHEDRLVSRVDLNVRSAFWRTWSFKSIDKDHYRGHWRVDITTTSGELLRRLYFEIK